MAENRQSKVDDVSTGPDPEFVRKARRWAWIVVVVLVAVFVWVLLREINSGKHVETWEQLFRVEHGYDAASTREWLHDVDDLPGVSSSDAKIKALEEFLAKNGGDEAVAAHLHVAIA